MANFRFNETESDFMNEFGGLRIDTKRLLFHLTTAKQGV